MTRVSFARGAAFGAVALAAMLAGCSKEEKTTTTTTPAATPTTTAAMPASAAPANWSVH